MSAVRIVTRTEICSIAEVFDGAIFKMESVGWAVRMIEQVGLLGYNYLVVVFEREES